MFAAFIGVIINDDDDNGGSRPESKMAVFHPVQHCPGGCTNRMSDNVVWLRLPGGGTGGEACCL